MIYSSIFNSIWRRWLPVMLALTTAIALNSCNPAQFKSSAAQVPQLVVAALGQPSTFNFPLNQSLYSVFGYIYDGLLSENGLTGELEPALAESWEISKGCLYLTTGTEVVRW